MYSKALTLLNSFIKSPFFLVFVCLLVCFVHLVIICNLCTGNVRVNVQKRSLNWPQDLDSEIRVVELYVVNDKSQVFYA